MEQEEFSTRLESPVEWVDDAWQREQDYKI